MTTNHKKSPVTASAPTSRKRRLRVGRLAVLALSCLLVLGLAGWGLFAGIRMLSRSFSKETETPALASAGDAASADGAARTACTPAEGYDLCLTFSGVGDNLIHETLYEGEGPQKASFDFAPYYEKTKPYTSASDISYINFEVLCAGEAFGYSGYPDFNAPSEFIDALDGAGFNWFSLASNHSLDRQPEGLIAELQDIHENHSHITTSGAYETQEDASEPVIIHVNGIKVGVATFTYGLNGRDKPEGYEWMIDTYMDNYGVMDYDLIDTRMEQLNKQSDVQIVTMHWGIEYNPAVDDNMAYLANYLHSKGADVIIGSHPHVIAPVEWIRTTSFEEGEEETLEQETLVYYSLGNFISGQQDMTNMIGGMARFQINMNSKTRDVKITDASFTPTITWFDEGETMYYTTTLAEYTDALASSHGLAALGQDTSAEFVKYFVNSVLGSPSDVKVLLPDAAGTSTSSSSSGSGSADKTTGQTTSPPADSGTGTDDGQ